jgi:hypothetical protein
VNKNLKNAGLSSHQLLSLAQKRGRVNKDVFDVRCFDDFEHWTRSRSEIRKTGHCKFGNVD